MPRFSRRLNTKKSGGQTRIEAFRGDEARQWLARPGSVSHRRVHKFTTPSHKDSLRSARLSIFAVSWQRYRAAWRASSLLLRVYRIGVFYSCSSSHFSACSCKYTPQSKRLINNNQKRALRCVDRRNNLGKRCREFLKPFHRPRLDS